uniref:Dicer dsRNA-binding fold domain-containing protein n=1 Tax=Arundo donax TaxID=35708 RepID=A0A0A8YKH0_ARUDO
MCTILLPK